MSSYTGSSAYRRRVNPSSYRNYPIERDHRPFKHRAAVYAGTAAGALGYTYLQNRVRNAVNSVFLRDNDNPPEGFDSEGNVNPDDPFWDDLGVAKPDFGPQTAAPIAAPPRHNFTPGSDPGLTMSKKRTSDAALVAAFAKADRLTKAHEAKKKYKRSGFNYAPKKSGTHGEVKYVDQPKTLINAVVAAATTPGTVLGLVSTGAGAWNRIGRKVCTNSLYIRGVFDIHNGTTGAPNPDVVRILVVYDRSPNGTQALYGDVIKATAADGTTVSSTALDGMNLDNRDRFKILADQFFAMPAVANSTTAPGSQYQQGLYGGSNNQLSFSRFILLDRLETIYKADSVPASLSGADIASGEFIMFVVSLGGYWDFTYTNRTRFTDA